MLAQGTTRKGSSMRILPQDLYGVGRDGNVGNLGGWTMSWIAFAPITA
jgi:hypothetical protein